MADHRPEQCSECYSIELALRPHRSWEGMVPANKEQLKGWFRSQQYRKRVRDERGMSEDEFERWVDEKAQHVLNEVTWGTGSYGSDSMLPADVRFKRTKRGNLYVGAGNLLAALEEAAWRHTDNPGKKRWLRNDRLWVSPGKVVLHRRNENGATVPITRADGRHERNIPPEPPNQRNLFRGKPATIVFAERVDYPAQLPFYLWTAPDVYESDLLIWWEIAGERGIMGYRQMKQGQFDVTRFSLINPDRKAALIAAERAK